MNVREKSPMTAIVVGIIFFVMGISLYKPLREQDLNRSATTTATIVDVSAEVSPKEKDTRRVYYPIIEYTVNGQKYEKKIFNNIIVPYQHSMHGTKR